MHKGRAERNAAHIFSARQVSKHFILEAYGDKRKARRRRDKRSLHTSAERDLDDHNAECRREHRDISRNAGRHHQSYHNARAKRAQIGGVEFFIYKNTPEEIADKARNDRDRKGPDGGHSVKPDGKRARKHEHYQIVSENIE